MMIFSLLRLPLWQGLLTQPPDRPVRGSKSHRRGMGILPMYGQHARGLHAITPLPPRDSDPHRRGMGGSPMRLDDADVPSPSCTHSPLEGGSRGVSVS
jgi:hypothetical protein